MAFPRMLLLLGALVATAQAQSKPGAFIIFGDSLSDTGNYFNTRGLGNRTYPVSNVTINGTRLPAYWRGRFSNAQGIWVDRLARNVRRIAVSSFAFGGGTLCPPSSLAGATPLDLRTPDVLNQTALYFRKLQTDARYNATISSREAIPVILAGGNDIRLAVPALSPLTAPALIQNLTQCMAASARVLLERGAKTIVLANAIPLDLTPAAIQANVGSGLSLLIGALNTQFASVATTLRTAYPNAKIIYWDVNKDFTTITRNSTALGFKFGNNVTCARFKPGDSALYASPSSVCRNPNEYLFFDGLHPSFKGHGLITDAFIRLMLEAGVGFNRTDLVRPQGVGRR